MVSLDALRAAKVASGNDFLNPIQSPSCQKNPQVPTVVVQPEIAYGEPYLKGGFSRRIRRRGYQSPENRWRNGDLPGIRGQKL
jgi:hypothetical protein